LADGFRNPPAEARVMVRWWWFGPAVTKAGLEREMKLMKEGGFGGFEVQPVYPLTLDDPSRGLINLRYLSPEFLEMVRFTAETAKRLGLRMDMTLGSGWPFGGPHIPLELAAGRLRVERRPVEASTSAMALPGLKTGERLVAAFLAPPEKSPLSPERLSLLPVVDDGRPSLLLPASKESRSVLLFIASHTGQQVKRAAFGAEGLVHDHYNRAALAVHLKEVGEKLMEAGAGSIRAVFCDSLEVFGSDWTPALPEEFRRRRGYELTPHLPALLPEAEGEAAAIRHDFGQTLTELVDEEFMAPLLEWSRNHKVLLRVQAYGIPPASLSSYRYVDLPEGEGAQWNGWTASRWAASAAHWLGRPVTHSETWTWIHSPVFRATPLDFKAEADQHFLQGINQLVGHGWPYSPEVVGRPGWRFYAAGVMNDHNPWWHVMPDLTACLARISFMLRQGEPANEVALYAPIHDAWASFTLGRVNLFQATGERLGKSVIPRLLEAGYQFDLVDDRMITELARVEKGRLVVVARHGYPIVVLPGVERIPAATLRRLREFVRAGGILVATRRLPSRAPGFLNQEKETREVRELVRELFEGAKAPAHFVADEDKDLGAVLAKLRRPDVIFTPSSQGIGFIRRSSPAAEIYFLANTTNRRVKATADFRVTERQAEWWDPATGAIRQAEIARRGPTGTVIELDLAPYESRLLVFPAAPTPGATPVEKRPTPILLPMDLSTNWEVTFEETGRKVTMETLRSWTEDPATRYYSGRATYRKTFKLAPEFVMKNVRLKLDFGETKPLEPGRARAFRTWIETPVREAAEVFVNGKRAGSVWRPPYEVEVTGLLRAGENRLEIIVSNLMINRMAGQPLPDYKDLIARYGDRFQPQDLENLQPVPSGLLGPIRLIPY
jgi:hypothetical protein